MDNSTEKEKNAMVDNPEPDENQTSEEKPARQTEKAELKNTEKEEVNITEETTAKKKDEKVVEDNKEVKEKIPAKKTKKADFTEEKVKPGTDKKVAEKAEPMTDKKVAEKAEPETDKKAVEKDEPITDKETSIETDIEKKPVSEKKSKESGTEENTPLEDFDWESLMVKEDDYAPKVRAEYENLYDETLSSIAENEVVDGAVISMTKREVVINIGYKSEGVVSLNEFRYNQELKIGDTVEVYVESKEDKNGQLILSHKKARALKSWDRVNEAHAKDEIIKGYIKCRTKGGMIVDVFGIESFLPGSQIDVKPIRDYDMYVGKTMEFKVVKINHEYKNVVVSHKALIEEELEQQKKEIIAKLEKGQVLEGTVKNITSYGVFIDLGGVDGLVHITDLSWGRVNHPDEIVELDKKLNVVILDFDDNKKRIALGIKQLTPHPWESLDKDIKVGDKVKGKVVVMADYGAFIEIAPGVEGLIHVSEMSWSQHLRSAQEFLKIGDEVKAVILTMDREDRKMSLGMKQLKPDPWEKIEKKYPVGSNHKAKVRNFTNFGIFVEIEEGVDGLIHISDLSWTKKIKHPAEFTSIGADIEVVVLEIDVENRRLSLGHKQLEENPWEVFESVFTVDSIHEGTIVEVFDKGAIVTLPYGIEGFVTPKHLVKEDGLQGKVDEKLEFKVLEFNKGAKRIILSHSRIFEDKDKPAKKTTRKSGSSAARKSSKRTKSSLEKTTLGDITDLAALKSEMEEKEDKITRKKKK
jgi:small subunit ribosomal protein S1